MSELAYVVAGCRPWNRRAFEECVPGWSGRWIFLADPGELTLDRLREIDPRYVFFLHWSWIVSEAIVESFECVGFHMTELPYGRGGSPLQNLIVRGHADTKLSAQRMGRGLDDGPLYLRRGLSLAGTAEQIYIRASQLSMRMIREIVDHDPEPSPQRGPVVKFVRRTPDESRIDEIDSLDRLNDFIRMLDAEGYPRAFLEHGNLRLEFRRSAVYDGELAADVRVTLREGS